MSGTSEQESGDWYEIRIQGRLDHRWAAWLDGLDLSQAEDGSTLLRGRVPDQAALHGLLNKLRDINLPLLSVTQVEPDSATTNLPGTTRTDRHRPKDNTMTTTPRLSSRTAGRLPADELRRSASIVGWLFILTYVTSIAAKIGFYPPLFAGDYITGPGQDSRVLWGAFSEAILIIANIGTATAMYTVMKRRHPNLAISYVAARITECVFIGVGILSVLTIVTLRKDYSGTEGADSAALATVGDALVALQEWTFAVGPGFVVGVGNGLILGYMMYRTALVPRRLAMLGLIGGPLIILSGAAAMLGIVEVGSAWQTVPAIPEFFWELGFGIYLVVRGFNPAALASPGRTVESR